ncbi:MAG: hypothetical protein ACOYOV_05470 [Bacteroidales bacterium]
MKNLPIFDIFFIIISAVVLLVINYFDYSILVSRFSVIFVLIAYFTGKYIGRLELRRKINADKRIG